MSNQLLLINEESVIPTFESCTRKSNVDLTVTNNHLVSLVNNWKCEIEECYSDHSIISFDIKQSNAHRLAQHFRCIVVKDERLKVFDELIVRGFVYQLSKNNTVSTGARNLDKELHRQVGAEMFQDVIVSACERLFRISGQPSKLVTGRTVPCGQKEMLPKN